MRTVWPVLAAGHQWLEVGEGSPVGGGEGGKGSSGKKKKPLGVSKPWLL